MKYDKFFELAKANGIDECELSISESFSLSFSLYHGEITKYQSNNGFSIKARGLINGKFGTATCDVWNLEKAQYLVNEILANAKVIQDDDPMFIFKGAEKYKKINTFNKELRAIPVEEKLSKLRELEKLVKEGDKRIIDVAESQYEESASKSILMNSHGLKLTQNSNYFFMFSQAVAKEGEQTKSDYDFAFGNDFAKFDVKKLANSIVEGVTGKLGGDPCQTGKYKAVLSNDVVASLMQAYLTGVDAEEVQKHTSLFIGKLGQKIASSKITVEDRPLAKTLFGRGFDDEGVPTYNKPIIKNGILQTYLYNLTTAAKDNVQSTGNASCGAKMGVAPTYLFIKPGKKSLEEVFEEIGNGVYITSVSGLHSGLDPQTGNFSLMSEGFLIKDGKKDRGLDVITVSGNLMKMFMDVSIVCNDSKEFISAINAPSMLVKSLSIGGK